MIRRGFFRASKIKCEVCDVIFCRFFFSNKILPVRIFIFSHFSERDDVAFLRSIANCLQKNAVRIQHVIFTSYDEKRNEKMKIDKNLTSKMNKKPINFFADRNLKNRFEFEIQKLYVEIWKIFDFKATISIKQTIEKALNQTKKFDHSKIDIQVLITEILHLINDALCLLQSNNFTQHLC